ncbi:MAG: DNA polymerase II large subunit [Candidatus Njordarchaeales archaeon]
MINLENLRELKIPKELEGYFLELLEKVSEAYKVAQRAREKGYDPQPFPEIKIATDMASRVEAMVGPPGIAERIRELLKEGKETEEIAFIIAKEIAEGKYGIEEIEKRAEQAIKTATAILVNGITAAPLEGITHVKIRKDGHLAVYYAGPIRSAGGTETALTIVIADIVRRTLGLPEYKAPEKVIERFVEEVVLYNRYASLQYPVDRDKIVYVMKNLPVEVTGEATLEVEVSGPYRNLPDIETSKVRGGAVLAINDGLIAKAKKVLKIVERYNVSGWEWLEKLVSKSDDENVEESKEDEEKKITPDYTYLSDVIAGRPVFASPSAIGGFRLRYGRSRNTGLAAVGIHPATMYILEEFLAIGTQIKTERPGKGAVVLPVDSVLPPLVKLKDGSVVSVNSVKKAKEIRKDIEKILFLGDILIAIGEFLENNHVILPSPIVEEWWIQELENAVKNKGWSTDQMNLDDLINKALNDPIFAFSLSEKLKIPLHPRWVYFWRNITGEEFVFLKEIIEKSSNNVLEYNAQLKEILEKLFLEHTINNGKIVLRKEDFIALKELMRRVPSEVDPKQDGLVIVNLSGIDIKDKYPVFIGARMGRPEKAKERMMKPPVHVLFPIGKIGTKSRSIIRAALNKQKSKIEAVNRYCKRCGIYTYKNNCPKCGGKTILKYSCPKCGKEATEPRICPTCGIRMVVYRTYTIDIAKVLQEAVTRLKVSTPKELKGVIGLTSEKKIPEPLEKGVLRGKYGLYVFKDGTIRFDATDIPLTHFKPKEIGVSIEKLRSLGYTHDIYGDPLEHDDQIVELKVQDVIINEDAAEYLVRVAKFVDELLVRFYGLEPFYNVKSKEDLIGHLVIGLAPHTSAGIIGRIIGFTRVRGTFAHPYWHAAKRRNCDGDEDAIILLLDALINFSREYLPKTRGGMMDAPLVVTVILNPLEVDSEVYNMDTMQRIPLEFYRMSQHFPKPDEIEKLIMNVEKKLGKPEQYYGFYFSHNTSNIAEGPVITSYKALKSMKDKIKKQFELMEKISAVNIVEVSDKILEAHLFPDILGNLRAFGTQQFRCTSCNTKYRRPPLIGKCTKCGGKIIQTIFRKTVLKYVPLAKDLIEKYKATSYNVQRYTVFKETDLLMFSNAQGGDIESMLSDLAKKYEDEKTEIDEEVVKGKKVIYLDDFFNH